MAALIILEGTGPLPVKSTFNSPLEGPATVFISGTAYTKMAPNMTGITLKIDDGAYGSAMCWANQNDNHMAMRTTIIPVSYLKYGEHTIELENAYGTTTTDENDYFQVVLLY